ncbi:hypothetical protein [Variovorax rhizosphaerae]|uniref:Uncharacterized protein n=1 Tax=Variovorax rhizosphaerae TaxID=1836200 RepID=A0ABU8WVX6_9BURK
MTPSSLRHAERPMRAAERPGLDARPAVGALRTREVEMREALAAATRERSALQSRIACAFRHQVAGDGDGPSEADLMLFAQMAVQEQRLSRRFAATRPALVARRR